MEPRIALPVLAYSLDDPELKFRNRVLNDFYLHGDMLPKEAAPGLIAALKAPRVPEKGSIALLISRADPHADEAVPYMIAAMNGNDYRHAAEALSKMASRDAQRAANRAAWKLRVQYMDSAFPWIFFLAAGVGVLCFVFWKGGVLLRCILLPLTLWAVLWYALLLALSVGKLRHPFESDATFSTFLVSSLIYGTAYASPLIIGGTLLGWTALAYLPSVTKSRRASGIELLFGGIAFILFVSLAFALVQSLLMPHGFP